MQFNSYIFILLFLPLSVTGYFLLNRRSERLGKYFLLGMSVWFYAAGKGGFLLLMPAMLAINFAISRCLRKKSSKCVLALGIALNVILLAYFKYSAVIVSLMRSKLGLAVPEVSAAMPLGISFITFQLIAYLIETYRGETGGGDGNFEDYLLFLCFFPKLLMGPLASPKELAAQFNDKSRKTVDTDNLAKGIQLFALGLTKKVILADTFAQAVNWGFSNFEAATSGDWIVVLFAYSFQIYFDFSGYSDMAIGIAKMLNIDLPINFDSPYKSFSIVEFWKRWHITLTKFLTSYVYYPLGGNRKGRVRTYVNILAVFFVSGLWHGNDMTFVVWGLLHGALSVLERIFQKPLEKVHPAFRWMYTFFVVSVLWMLFRANSVSEWLSILKRIASLREMNVSAELLSAFELPEARWLFAEALHASRIVTGIKGFFLVLLYLLALTICLIPENNYKRPCRLKWTTAAACSLCVVWCLVSLGKVSTFIYLKF